MSPEPVQPHPAKEQTWDTPNLSIDIAFDDPNHLLHLSDNEDEYINTTGYLPLAQEPTDSDAIIDDDDDDYDDDDDDDDEEEGDDVNCSNADDEVMKHDHEWTLSTKNTSPPLPSSSSTIEEPLKLDGDLSRSSIYLDTEKINQVKSIMANFKLPIDNHPPWANTISEGQWKKQLIDKIKDNDSL